MTDVLFKSASYAVTELNDVIFEILNETGGGRIQPGMRVLVKPNLLLPARPESAVTTHPLVVRAAVQYVLEKGARPVVADSPGVGSFEKILRKGGYLDATGGLDVIFRPFRDSVRTDIGEPFGVVNLAREALQSDFVISLAKLKTHAQMLLTLGVSLAKLKVQRFSRGLVVAVMRLGLGLGAAYLLCGRKLWVVILAHGYMDTILLVQAYLSESAST